jgi:hypothetical protein
MEVSKHRRVRDYIFKRQKVFFRKKMVYGEGREDEKRKTSLSEHIGGLAGNVAYSSQVI